ncbi:YajG family lipoprotein [Salinispirillum marinum]|uniref:YajG family lipoprotein n=2 Tax=Saccharospirillaceae TaxID=255527 RepID=A0ABV8BGY3_9GAMM
MLKSIILLMSVMVFAVGCAVSPQQVVVEPKSEATFAGSVAGTLISVTVRDNRGTSVLGNLGGTYSETSTLSSSNNVAQELGALLNAKLTEAGYVITPNNAQFSLSVSLNELAYEYVTEGLVRQVETVAEIAYRVETADGNSFREGRFRTPQTQPRATRPTSEENKVFLEEVLTASIDRMLTHRPLAEFMQ